MLYPKTEVARQNKHTQQTLLGQFVSTSFCLPLPRTMEKRNPRHCVAPKTQRAFPQSVTCLFPSCSGFLLPCNARNHACAQKSSHHALWWGEWLTPEVDAFAAHMQKEIQDGGLHHGVARALAEQVHRWLVGFLDGGTQQCRTEHCRQVVQRHLVVVLETRNPTMEINFLNWMLSLLPWNCKEILVVALELDNFLSFVF